MAPTPIETDINAVAAILHARTKDDVGNELGVFTSATRPTAAQVTDLLIRAKRSVVNVIGTAEPCTADLAADAANLIHLRAAMMVELSYFPEQVASNRSHYEQLKALYDGDIVTLAEAVAEICGTGTGEPGVGGQLPAYDYGESPTIGKRTVW